jgi:hypothetical protein
MTAPTVLLPGLVQIKAFYDPNPDTAEHPMNLLWFVQRAPVTLHQADMQQIAQTFDPLWATFWKQWGCTSRHYIGSVATDYSTQFGQYWDTRGIYTPLAGILTTQLPPNVAALVSLHVAERWRGGHARIYLPWGGGLGVSTSDANMMTTTTQSALTTDFGLIEPGMNGIAVGGGLSQRVYRQRTDPVKAHLMPVTSYTVNFQLASQRRRMRKVPHH